MKKSKFLAAVAAAVMTLSAVPFTASADLIYPGNWTESSNPYVAFTSLTDLNQHVGTHNGSVILRDPWTDMSTEMYDVESVWIPSGFSEYENSINNIIFSEQFVSVTFSFSNGSYTLYDYGTSSVGKSNYYSAKKSAYKQKVNGRTVYRDGFNYCWKQSGRYFVLSAGSENAFSYCSAEEYILPEYAAEGITYINGQKYYVQSDGSYYVGWKTIDGKKYFFGMDGAAITQNMIIGNVRYTFDKSGVCTGTYTGWLEMEGFRYYCKNGRFVTGVNKISGKTYTFSSEGILLSAYPG